MLISSLFFGLFALKYSVYMYEIMDAKEEKLPIIPKQSREVSNEKVEVIHTPRLVWGKHLDGNIFGLLMVKPEYMSLQELYHYVEYLK